MRVKETDDYILVTRDIGDSEESFREAFEAGLVTLMVGKESKKVTGLKIWKNKEILNVAQNKN